MSDIQSRQFSTNYSGLLNQSVIGLGIAVLAVCVQESFKRRRRGKYHGEGLGSRESWEFGYLYQGRSWAKHPSPPSPAGWPLSWVKQVVDFPEDELRRLRGIDATLYVRFLRGCFWFCLLHTFTTFPILFPIHFHFSAGTFPAKSMSRASISSLVESAKGLSLLWIHICLLFYLTFTWMATLIWTAGGAFRFRVQQIAELAARIGNGEEDHQYHPHPHPPYYFHDVPPSQPLRSIEGLKLRTVMVSNLPHQLRSEKELKEYFEYYMSRPLDKPSVGFTSSVQPGFFNKWLAFFFNKAKHIPAHMPGHAGHASADVELEPGSSITDNVPIVERVVIVRKMTELASLLERREEVLRRLETAHLKLAQRALITVMDAMAGRKTPTTRPERHWVAKTLSGLIPPHHIKAEGEELIEAITVEDETQKKTLVEVLGPFVNEFDLPHALAGRSTNSTRYAFWKHPRQKPIHTDTEATPLPPMQAAHSSAKPLSSQRMTIWETLLRLDRTILNQFQPLINLSQLFRDKTVPAIDYYTAKLVYLSSMITENRAKAVNDYEPVSTAFVTFADPLDARRACEYLAVHPDNPLACLIRMAPGYDEIDWNRLMKSNLKVEFLRDWAVEIGIWVFTLFWIFPVSLLVGLVSIDSIGNVIPKLKTYLLRHRWESEVLQSFVPVVLVSLLALSIPPILLLIAKKVHTITTLSTLHDVIMTRYYKFLVINVLVFFCVGTVALQSFLGRFKAMAGTTLLDVVSGSFPTAGPFYVGWLIFIVAMHGGLELALFGLPLLMYRPTAQQVAPRKRAVGIRPRTFNFYYWLPTHILVMHVLLLFYILNPLVIPFGALYYFIETGIVKNQLLHVYAKNYECNGHVILIRVMRYSLDGLMFAQVVLMVYMIVLRKDRNAGAAAVLVVMTAIFKISMTYIFRARFEADDILEAQVACGQSGNTDDPSDSVDIDGGSPGPNNSPSEMPRSEPPASTWRLPDWVNFTYSSVRPQIRPPPRRLPNPFTPGRSTFSRLNSVSSGPNTKNRRSDERAALSPQREASGEDDQQSIRVFEPQPESVVNGVSPNMPDLAGPVVPHPPPVPWDDQPNGDLPYDNPYYTRAINDVLWLPRNPFGILDLDDTVDLRMSITSDPQVGRLGSWPGFPGRTLSSKSSATEGARPLKQYTGTEEIDLPPAIARRVQANEADIEQTNSRRPSMFGIRRTSSGEKEQFIPRRPSFIESGQQVSFHPTPPGRTRSSSFIPTLGSPRTLHAMPTEHELATRRDALTEGMLGDISPTSAHASGSQLPYHASPLSRTITTQEAVVQEIIAEEEAGLADRQQKDGEEAESDARPKKRWWLFSKAG